VLYLTFLLRPIQERRKILQDNVKEIPGRIVHSEMKIIKVLCSISTWYLKDIKIFIPISII